MLKGWLVLLAVLLGTGFSFAYQTNPLLIKDPRWTEARRLLAAGQAPAAKQAFEELLAKYPNEADLHLFLGICYLRLRDPQSAETAIRKAVALDSKHVEARTLLGWVYSEIRGNNEAAIIEYSRVVELKPTSAEAYNNLGVAFKKKGDLEKALENFSRAVRLRPNYSEALSNRGWVYSAQQKWSEARQEFEHALKVNPGDEGALYGLSQVLRESRDYTGAQRILGQLIDRSPNFVYWLQWSRIGLVRYYWVLLLTALAFYLTGRYRKARR